MKWSETKHKTFSDYLNSMEESWINEYQANPRDYVREMFVKLVGSNFVRFLKSYNKRMKLDIDAVPGLSDYLFGENPENGRARLTTGKLFFTEGGFKLSHPCDYNVEHLHDVGHSDVIQPYFDECNKLFNNIDHYHDCNAMRNFEYSIIDYVYNSYGRTSDSNCICNCMNFYSNYMHEILRKFKISVINDVINGNSYQSVTLMLTKKFQIRFVYWSMYRPVGDGPKMVIHSDKRMSSSGYSDLYYLCERDQVAMFVQCRKPIFTDEQCKFFHVYEKAHMQSSSWEQDYTKQWDANDPKTQFIDQLYLKYAFLGNETIQEVLQFLNTTKSSDYRYNAEEAIGNFGEWYLSTPGVRENYDRYKSSGTYNVELQNKLPIYLDFIGKSLLENFMLYRNYGKVPNESPEQRQNRIDSLSGKDITIETIIDVCNLKRDEYFKRILRSFQLGYKEIKD